MKKEELMKNIKVSWRNPYPHDAQTKSWSENERAYRAIVALIKTEVTEEWIEKKAKKLYGLQGSYSTRGCKDFIRSLVEEVR